MKEFRKPMLIKEYRLLPSGGNFDVLKLSYDIYPLCPRCKTPTHHDYQKYCTECGQRLAWDYSKMRNASKNITHVIIRQDTNEIVYIADLEHCKMYLPVYQSIHPHLQYTIIKLK